MTESVFV